MLQIKFMGTSCEIVFRCISQNTFDDNIGSGNGFPWENKWSPWAHRDHGGHGSGAQWSQLGEVTAQSRRGHSSVTARSQLSHGEVTAQSRHLQYDHGSVMARSQLNHGPGHGSVTSGCDDFGHRELTLSSRWAVTVANFFSHGLVPPGNKPLPYPGLT